MSYEDVCFWANVVMASFCIFMLLVYSIHQGCELGTKESADEAFFGARGVSMAYGQLIFGGSGALSLAAGLTVIPLCEKAGPISIGMLDFCSTLFAGGLNSFLVGIISEDKEPKGPEVIEYLPWWNSDKYSDLSRGQKWWAHFGITLGLYVVGFIINRVLRICFCGECEKERRQGNYSRLKEKV